jgi:DNA-binding NarL/FixJ family response regulator
LELQNDKLSDLASRELAILQLVIAGKTNKAIVNEICVSKKTSEVHLAIAIRRLKVGISHLRRPAANETSQL